VPGVGGREAVRKVVIVDGGPAGGCFAWGPGVGLGEDEADWDFNGAAAEPGVVQDAFATWKAEIARADDWLDALTEDSLGREVPHGDGAVAARDVLVHLIEEYARHAGHADLLRECIDGRTGQ
jgi:hypothetical protein